MLIISLFMWVDALELLSAICSILGRLILVDAHGTRSHLSLEFTFCIVEFSWFRQDFHVKNPKPFRIKTNIYCVQSVDQHFLKANASTGIDVFIHCLYSIYRLIKVTCSWNTSLHNIDLMLIINFNRRCFNVVRLLGFCRYKSWIGYYTCHKMYLLKYAYQRLKSACASAQSDQRLCCPHKGALHQ